MSHCCRFAASLALLLMFAGRVPAQQDACRLRVVPVHVSTLDGTSLPDLTPAQFEATSDDKTVRVTSVGDEQTPHRLVILLDASGSVRAGTSSGWDATVEVASQLVAALPPLEVGLALFAEQVEPVVEPTESRERLVKEIERLRTSPASGTVRRQRTALWDSVLDSIRRFGPLQPGDVVYVVTDGVDNFSQARPAAVTQTLLTAGIRLFAFAIANQGFAYGAGDLERMVEDTGGVVTAGSATDWRAFKPAPASSPIGTALYAQHRQILGFHRLEMELAETVLRPQPWHLALTGLDENQTKNVVLNYPARLFPCN